MLPRIAFITGFLLLAAPTHAQSASPPAELGAPSPAQDGYRLGHTADGFRLVEHGIWEVPETAALPTPPRAGTPDGGRRHSLQAPTASGPNIFRRAAYLPHVYAAEAEFGLPTGLLDALIWTESRYNPFAVSKAGAAGLGQLMPGTAKELGVTNRFDPLANVSGAARYLRQMLDRFGVIHLALAAYNAGPGAVERAKGIPRNGETPGYVRNVLSRWRP